MDRMDRTDSFTKWVHSGRATRVGGAKSRRERSILARERQEGVSKRGRIVRSGEVAEFPGEITDLACRGCLWVTGPGYIKRIEMPADRLRRAGTTRVTRVNWADVYMVRAELLRITTLTSTPLAARALKVYHYLGRVSRRRLEEIDGAAETGGGLTLEHGCIPLP